MSSKKLNHQSALTKALEDVNAPSMLAKAREGVDTSSMLSKALQDAHGQSALAKAAEGLNIHSASALARAAAGLSAPSVLAKVLEAKNPLFNAQFVDSFRNAKKANESLADSIRKANESIGRIEASYHIPSDAPLRFESPQIELPGEVLESITEAADERREQALATQQKLDALVQSFKEVHSLGIDMADVVNKMSKNAADFIVNFGEAANKADKTSKRALWMALTAIVVSVLLSGFQIWQASVGGARQEALVKEAVGAISEGLNATTSKSHDSAEATKQLLEEIKKLGIIIQNQPSALISSPSKPQNKPNLPK